MTLLGLAVRNLRGGGFRNAALATAVLTLVALSFSSTAILRGADRSLQLGLDRLGADLTVVPASAANALGETIALGQATEAWMPDDNVGKIAAVPGVAQVSAQLYLSTLSGASCCSASEMFVIAFDAATDFVVQPWLRRHRSELLADGEAVGGSKVSVPPGESGIRLYGTTLKLAGNLEGTGTGLDQTLYVGFNTARAIAAASEQRAKQPLRIPPSSVSVVQVKLAPGADSRAVVKAIEKTVPGVRALEGSEMMRSYRRQMIGLVRGVTLVLASVWVAALLLTALVFSSAAEQRRRELSVLRALGATRPFIAGVLLVEAALIAALGGFGGVLLGGLALRLAADLVSTSLGLPFIFPSPGAVIALSSALLAVAVAVALLAALLPALRTSRAETAVEMRE